MELICPGCKSALRTENINVATDLAKCDFCHILHKVSTLAETQEQEKVHPLPVGTKIRVQKGYDDTIEIEYPRNGFTPVAIPIFIFTFFWLAFVSFWTWGASQGSIIFAMFSIPFWLAGFGMLGGLINLVTESQTIILSKRLLTLKKKRVIMPEKLEVLVNDIEAIQIRPIKMNPFSLFSNFGVMMKIQKSSGPSGIETLSLITKQKTVHFFESADDEEKKWLTSTLNGMLKRLRS
jgi:hypothetical protein